MLSAAAFDQLSTPIVDLYEQYASSVIADIARRLAKMGKVTATAAWQMQRLTESGAVYQNAIRELSKITGQSEATLRATFEAAGVKSLAWDDRVYRAKGLRPIPLNLSPQMLNVLLAGLSKTGGTIFNLTQTTALSAQRLFIDQADLAYTKIVTGSFSYDAAIRQAVKNVAAQGLSTISYPSGRIEQLDSSMRRAVLTGVGQTTGALQMSRMDELGTDLVAVSAHAGARNQGSGPMNHESWQGKVYSRSGTSKKYGDFYTVTGYGTGEGLGGWNCVLEGTLVSSLAKRAAYRREYSGEIIVIHTAGGKELSATPNHPILTDHGWVAAGLLTLGDYVICRPGLDGLSTAGPDVDQGEARIEDVFNSFCVSGSRFNLPVSACHFHGDVSDGEVEIVFSDGLLGNNADLLTEQELAEIGLGLPPGLSKPFVPEGALPQVRKGALHSPDSIMGGFGKLLAAFWRHPLQSLDHRIRTIVGFWNSQSGKIFPNLHFVYSGVGGNLVFPHARLVHGEQVLRPYSIATHDAHFPITLSENVPLIEASLDGMNGTRVFISDIPKGLSGQIQVDNVVFIERQYFEGHVYNLQTEGEWYSANGIITHNCRHSFYPFFEGLSEAAYTQQQLDEYADKTVTLPDGREVSQYEASQVQRGLERHIRDWKRQADALSAAGLDNTAEIGRVRAYQEQMRDFVKATNLSRQGSREGGKVMRLEVAPVGVTTPAIPVVFNDKTPEKLYESLGYQKANDTTRELFTKSVNDLPPEIQGMWRAGDVNITLATADGYVGRHQGNWIMIGNAWSAEGKADIFQHEFIHHIIGQNSITSVLGKYNPTVLFQHALESSGSVLGEDLTMVLSAFSKDRGMWIKMVREAEAMTEGIAGQKIDEAIRFLREIGFWI